jgi:prepilin-type processing-associated H-X9-DG protein
MNLSSSPSVLDDQLSNTSHALTSISPCLSFGDCDGYRVISCRHEVLYRVALSDAHHLAVVAVALRQSQLATQTEIATAFGHSVATQRRWETRYLQHGSAGLRPKTPTGRKPKSDTSQRAFVRRWFEAGVTNREMARRLAISETTIRRVLRQLGLHRPPTPAAELPFAAAPTLAAPLIPGVPAAIAETTAALGVDAGAAAVTPNASPTPPVAAVASPPEAAVLPPESVAGAIPASSHGFTIDCDPADRSGDRVLARQGLLDDAVPLFGDHAELPRAGVLLAIPVLQAHGGLEVFQRLYGSIGPAFYGLRTTVLSLVLLALLRIKRPEHVKEYAPELLGRLVGLDRLAEVKTLRRKLTVLAGRDQGPELLKELARLRLAQHEERVAFLYVDGHVREYSGQAMLAKTKKAQRAVATCAATDTWVHDAEGEPLLLVTSEMNAGLTQVLEAIVGEAKELVPAGRRLTVLFDRGGWSVKLFARLIALGVDIITYRKGAKQTLPRSRFVAHRVREEGGEKTRWLYEQARVRVGRLRPHRRRPGAGPEYLWLRQVTVLRDDGRQTVIVTNRTDLVAVEVVTRLFRRWRQENYFKYMAEEFALDALVEYGVDEVSEGASRPNPERKRVAKERQRAQGEVTRLRAQLGAAANNNEERQRPTMRGFKVAQANLRSQLAQAEQREHELTEQLQQLPPRVPATGLKSLKKEKKLIVDALKMIAYQVETALLGRLVKHYARAAEEGRTLLHAAFQSSARMEVTATELKITIAAQSSPHRTEALAKLCEELDAEAVCYPGSHLRVRLAVEGQKPLTA